MKLPDNGKVASIRAFKDANLAAWGAAKNPVEVALRKSGESRLANWFDEKPREPGSTPLPTPGGGEGLGIDDPDLQDADVGFAVLEAELTSFEKVLQAVKDWAWWA